MKFITCCCCSFLLALSPALTAKEAAENARLPLEELQLFAQIFEQIRTSYVEEVDDKTLLENAITGLLGELDPHSAFLKADSYTELQEQTTGEFGGLGIEVGMEDGLVKVISPIDDSPAAKAGVQPGDLIVKLDDKAVQGMSLEEAIALMRGAKGTAVKLTIVRDGSDKPIEFTIVRDSVKAQSIRSRSLEPGFGYVRIAQFQVNTGAEFKKSIENMLAKDKTLKGLVLDLRNNPGGLLPASVEVADTLLDKGLIVYTKGRVASANTEFSATPGDVLKGIPVVLLINGGTASAAEIVAGALQDHHRAVVTGTQSFGKGSVQSVLPLPDGRAIKLTTARYFTPNGRSIQADGIHPDITVARAEIRNLDAPPEFKEANLQKHLNNGDNPPKKAKAGPTQSQQMDDNQLIAALNLLKGLTLLQKE